jgi:UDP-3-O-[3-hydroxymyristoyl] glucosamine N-acyltransferase
MSKQEIEFRDPIVQAVVNKFVSRSDVGFAKYGVTLKDDKSDMVAWLNHLQEELMDAVLYLQRAKEEELCRQTNSEAVKINNIDVVDELVVTSKKKVVLPTPVK